jgi:hypothetical protein
MRRVALAVIGFLALSGIVGYAATTELFTGSDDSDGSGAAAPAASDETAGGEEAAADAAVQTEGARAAVAELPGLPLLGSSVIKTAHLSIGVKEGSFEGAFQAASLVAGTYGGFVQSSSTAGTDERSGELVLRVPADRFDDAMADLADLGNVDQQSVSGEDVSAQFVDLEARLRTWQSQEAVLLDLMGRATTIEETIRVQRELQDVQFRIEQIQGQLRLLEDRTELSTIQVSLRENGVPLVIAAASERPSLVEAWDRAVEGFLGVCYAVVVGLGYLVPITAIAGIAWLAYRRLAAPGATAGRS